MFEEGLLPRSLCNFRRQFGDRSYDRRIVDVDLSTHATTLTKAVTVMRAATGDGALLRRPAGATARLAARRSARAKHPLRASARGSSGDAAPAVASAATRAPASGAG